MTQPSLPLHTHVRVLDRPVDPDAVWFGCIQAVVDPVVGIYEVRDERGGVLLCAGSQMERVEVTR